MCSFYRGTIECPLWLHHCVVQRLLEDSAAHSEHSQQDHWHLSALPYGHLPLPSHPLVIPASLATPLILHTQLNALREKVPEPQGPLHKTAKQLPPSGCQYVEFCSLFTTCLWTVTHSFTQEPYEHPTTIIYTTVVPTATGHLHCSSCTPDKFLWVSVLLSALVLFFFFICSVFFKNYLFIHIFIFFLTLEG